jgi:hypothetical protein
MSNTNIKKNQSAFMHQRSYQMVVLLLAFNLSGLFAQGLSSLATNTGINFGTMVTKKHFRTNLQIYLSQ